MTNPLVLDLGKNAHGQWVARDPATGNMALIDTAQGVVVKPGTQPGTTLLECFAWVLAQVAACDVCTEHEGCAPFKA